MSIRSHHCYSLGAEGALFLQLPVPQDSSRRWDGIDGAGECLRWAILVGVNRGHQRVLTNLGGYWRREQDITPPSRLPNGTLYTHPMSLCPYRSWGHLSAEQSISKEQYALESVEPAQCLEDQDLKMQCSLSPLRSPFTTLMFRR